MLTQRDLEFPRSLFNPAFPTRKKWLLHMSLPALPESQGSHTLFLDSVWDPHLYPLHFRQQHVPPSSSSSFNKRWGAYYC